MFNPFIEFISWRAVLDILLITLGLFFVYSSLRRLGTWKILIGILLAVAIFFVARFLELDGIIWFYNNVSQVAVIGLIVLLQPEIRKLFERAISTRRRDIDQMDNGLISLISEAAKTLAKQKRGALIVLPGKESMSEYLAGGQVLKAEISLPLILSIFDPHSPGHDGAIIIENGKIVRFGVRLPISSSDKLPKEYGTRHYAAAGLSEVTDALVIAISEERGVITVFQRGTGTLQQSKTSLENVLIEHERNTQSFLSPVETNRRFYPWPEVATSFLIACVFWYSVVVGEAEIHEKVITIPVEYIRTPKDLALTGKKPSEVKVHLVGPKSSLVNIIELSVKIDLSKAVAGKQKFTITDDDINLAKRVKLIDVQPSSLSLDLVQIVEKELVVKPQLVGKLSDSLIIVSTTITPSKVRALVRSSGVNEEDLLLITTPIFLGKIKANTTIFGKIIVPPRIQPVDRKWPDVEIQIKVKKRKTASSTK